MSEYPSAAFTSHTRKYNLPDQKLFTDYGCWESLDVDIVGNEFLLFVKKQRSLHAGVDLSSTGSSATSTASKTIDQRILSPEHDFLILGKPERMKSLIDEDVNSMDHYKKRNIPIYNAKQNKTRTQITATYQMKQMNNLAYDNPDVTHQTFIDVLSELCDGGHTDKRLAVTNALKKIPRNIVRQKQYLELIDPSLCDVGLKILEEPIVNEIQLQSSRYYCDRDFSGGCLVYNCLGKRGGKQYGFLACPQGQGLDELSFKLLAIDSNQLVEECPSSYYSSSTKRSPLVPTVNVGSDYRQTLNGRILQVEAVPAEKSDIYIVGARSDYHVLMNTFSSACTEWNPESNSAVYTSDEVVQAKYLLKTGANSKVSSIALSPYISGECAIATEDRCVRLWSLDTCSNSQSIDYEKDTQTLLSGTMGGLRSGSPWRQVRYAAHPRQFYITDTKSVCLFDMRAQHEFSSLLNIASSKHTYEHEKIYCIESGRRYGNEYECLIATDYNLFLMDQRHCGEPLIQWGTNMSLPPCYICPYQVASLEAKAEFSTSKWFYKTVSVLLGNQRAHEVYSYQLCKTRRTAMEPPNHTNDKVYTPQCVGPPRRLSGFKDMWNSLKTTPTAHHNYLKARTSKMLVGIEAIPLGDSTEKGEDSIGGVVVMHINAVGDIGYQTLSMRNPREAFGTTELITAKTFTSFLSDEEERSLRKIEDIKLKNYRDWSESACLLIDEQNNEKVGIRRQYIAPHKKCTISDSFFEGFCPTTTDLTSESCLICNPEKNPSNSEHEDLTCMSCGVNLLNGKVILDHFHHLENSFVVLNSAMFHHDVTLQQPIMGDESTSVNWAETGDEIDNELGKLLKGTWNGTYEEYWNKMRSVEQRREREEKIKQDRITFDLSDRENIVSASELSTKLQSQEAEAVKKAKRKNEENLLPGERIAQTTPKSTNRQKRKADVLKQQTSSSGVDSPSFFSLMSSESQSFSNSISPINQQDESIGGQVKKKKQKVEKVFSPPAEPEKGSSGVLITHPSPSRDNTLPQISSFTFFSPQRKGSESKNNKYMPEVQRNDRINSPTVGKSKRGNKKRPKLSLGF